MPPNSPLSTPVNQSQVVCTAGAPPINQLADNPTRNFLMVKNVGVNQGYIWFKDSKNSGQAWPLGPQQSWPPVAGMRVPFNRLFLQSAAGTTFIIIEGWELSNPPQRSRG